MSVGLHDEAVRRIGHRVARAGIYVERLGFGRPAAAQHGFRARADHITTERLAAAGADTGERIVIDIAGVDRCETARDIGQIRAAAHADTGARSRNP